MADGGAFGEGRPAGGGETLTNPCDKWFCSRARQFVRGGSNGTRVFAATFGDAHDYYRMEWEPDSRDVPGIDRSAEYAAMCNKC
jgi:hypothetical protein